MTGFWASPSFEISEDDEKRFVVSDSKRRKWLATFLMFADAKDFVLRRMHSDSLDLAASALERKPVAQGIDWGKP
jgi:hypothetical protein